MPLSQSGGSGGAGSPGFEIGYDQITAPVNIASTTEATGTAIITCAAHIFDGAPVICQFSAPSIENDLAATGDLTVASLFEGATQIARLVEVSTTFTGSRGDYPCAGFIRFTPTVGSHTYTITAFATSTTGTPRVLAGPGGTGALAPAFCRFTKV